MMPLLRSAVSTMVYYTWHVFFGKLDNQVCYWFPTANILSIKNDHKDGISDIEYQQTGYKILADFKQDTEVLDFTKGFHLLTFLGKCLLSEWILMVALIIKQQQARENGHKWMAAQCLSAEK